ncbi:MAG: deoxyribodipyrimidine photo-lyase [Maribacter sp.]
MEKITIFWHRRDLRLNDNAGLYRALKESKYPVLPLFIFDTKILEQLEDKADARVQFIHRQISLLHQELKALGSSIMVRHGNPIKIWKELLAAYNVDSVYTNKDYEPYALKRDGNIAELLRSSDIQFHRYKDQVIFEEKEVTKADGLPYTIFTPYSRKWKEKLNSKIIRYTDEKDKNYQLSYYLKPYPNHLYHQNYFKTPPLPYPTLSDIGFKESPIKIPNKTVTQKTIKEYDEKRNFPSLDATSKLGIHFRFGTISIREKAWKASLLNDTFLSELIWRDFYAMILSNFPKVANNAFREKYESIEWRDNEEDFKKWCEGKTGYPLVDAGMRELNHTGHMHNRVRMLVASFLTKHLLIDWRWGEAYFANKLLDFDLASNNGGWQWAAGCGTDAAPYFRIFSPMSQHKKFDKDSAYIKKWVPEYGSFDYSQPMVDHKFARERCLRVFKEGLAKAEQSKTI